jgi:plastocyanin
MIRSTAAAIAAVALLVAGCGGSSKKTTSAAGNSTLSIAAAPSGALKFTQTSLTTRAGKVTIHFTNKSKVPHGVVITGHGVNAKAAVVTDGSSSATVTLKPGKYTFYCPVPGHRAAGMQGTLTVS